MPYEGKVFDTVDEAILFYEKYGWTKGLSTKKRNSKKRPRSEEIARATFCCLSNGLSKKNQTSSTSEQDGKKHSSYQCGCKATLNINWRENLGKYVVTSFSDVHNHNLVYPRNHHRMKINHFFPEAAKNLTKTFELHNISISKVPTLFPDKTFNK
ncbi:hypothetical protein GIB67_017688, partial [Kingdonia uniflora]